MKTKTIEERALEYGKSFEFQKGTRYVSVASKEYVKIATEQREIDIQRAVEWLSSRLSFPAIDRDMFVASFEQAMKGE